MLILRRPWGAGVVRELLYEELVGAAENVGRHALVREIVFVEMLDERVDDLVRDQRLAGTDWTARLSLLR
jgi:hypothetical protein